MSKISSKNFNDSRLRSDHKANIQKPPKRLIDEEESEINKEFTWASGEKYSGGIKANKFHGNGTFSWPDGSIYEGEFFEGKRNGEGTIKLANGESYTGGWKDGEYHGQGKFTWANGTTYEGRWENGVRTNGEYKWPNNLDEKKISKASPIRGNSAVTENKDSGLEPIKLGNGDMYNGGLKDEKCHGKGTYNWVSGHKYTGELENGSKKNGEYIWSNGDRFLGGFQNDKPHGIAEFKWADGSSYKGEYVNGTRTGKGSNKSARGYEYEGIWENGEYIGMGRLKWGDHSMKIGDLRKY